VKTSKRRAYILFDGRNPADKRNTLKTRIFLIYPFNGQSKQADYSPELEYFSLIAGCVWEGIMPFLVKMNQF
jgi:hypothetical protein